MTTDNELVQAARSGNQVAFGELVSRYENRVYRLARKMLRDERDAEDVLQETFISAFRHLDSFRGDSEFSTWIYRIATNASLMRIRASKPQVPLDEAMPGDDSDFTPQIVVDWSISPEEAVLNSEIRTQMDTALANLPDTLRVVFVLRDIEGLSVQETARVLDISVSNVKTRLHRARLKLREALSCYFREKPGRIGRELAQ